MESAAREHLVDRLKSAFKARAMGVHVARLAEYAYCRRLGKACGRDGWDDAFVQRWAAILQETPFETALPVRSRAERCPTCSPGAGCQVSCNCEDRYLLRCADCGLEWLVLLPS